MESNCEDCGCPVEKRLMPGNSQPPMEADYSFRDGREVYHDMSQCINYLRDQLNALKLLVSRNQNRVETLEG